jgi:hypothetical protein
VSEGGGEEYSGEARATLDPPSLFGDDTSPAVQRLLIAAYRGMSGAAKLERVCALNQATLALALANIRQQHPQADERELLRLLAIRRYGSALGRQIRAHDVRRAGF